MGLFFGPTLGVRIYARPIQSEDQPPVFEATQDSGEDWRERVLAALDEYQNDTHTMYELCEATSTLEHPSTTCDASWYAWIYEDWTPMKKEMQMQTREMKKQNV
nr:hypothetical protein TetV2_00641 [Oceanusvirus sp.]